MKRPFKYLALAEQLRNDILNGIYAGGEKIDTEIDLSEKYQMSRQAVRQALDVLETENLIERIRGSGTYVNRLKYNKTKTMQICVALNRAEGYFLPALLRGIENELTKCSYSLILAVTGNRIETERNVLLSCLEKQVDGLLIEPTQSALPNPNLYLYEEMESYGIPIVFIYSYYPNLKNPLYVAMNDKQGGYDAVCYLQKHGHKNIAGVFKNDDLVGHLRYAGFCEAMFKYNLNIQSPKIIWFNSENLDNILEKEENNEILEAVKDCTAIVCQFDEPAVRIIDMLIKNGIRVPQDVAVISFDNSMYANINSIKITSFIHRTEEIGAIAAQKVINVLSGKTETPTILDWELSEKESTNIQRE